MPWADTDYVRWLIARINKSVCSSDALLETFWFARGPSDWQIRRWHSDQEYVKLDFFTTTCGVLCLFILCNMTHHVTSQRRSPQSPGISHISSQVFTLALQECLGIRQSPSAVSRDGYVLGGGFAFGCFSHHRTKVLKDAEEVQPPGAALGSEIVLIL